VNKLNKVNVIHFIHVSISLSLYLLYLPSLANTAPRQWRSQAKIGEAKIFNFMRATVFLFGTPLLKAQKD